MEKETQNLIFKIIATICVLVYGVAVAVLMLMSGGLEDMTWVAIRVGMLAISIAALVYIWYPRKKAQ